MTTINAEVITIGDEILYGQITDTNTQWLSAELSKIGIKTIRKSSVGDQKENILTIIKEATERASLIILTGGLGPTNDDITKKTLSEFCNQSLVMNQEVLADVRALFQRRGKEVSPINELQALIPESSTALRNHWGTAPGMWIPYHDKIIIALPGVPYEMKGIMNDYGLKAIRNHFKTPHIQHQIIRTAGIGESIIAELIKSWEDSLPSYLSLAYLPSYTQVKLRITGQHADEVFLSKEMQKYTELLKHILSPIHVYAWQDINIEEHIGNLLNEQHKSLSITESCTGGFAQHLITSIPGSSKYFKGGIVSYSNEIKSTLLHVPKELLTKHGAVSKEVAQAMATGVLNKFNTDYAVAVTGIAGPDGGTAEKPVGLVWMCFASKEGLIYSKSYQFGIHRDVNIRNSAYTLLNLLRLGIENKLS